ncbi:MAG: outer membrane beta-barrel protein [Candidatus Korobacteraceae bacterium]
MNVLFSLVCGLSVLFFVVFLFECSRPLRNSKKSMAIRKLPDAAAVDSITGRRFLVHLEQQMSEFLSHHGHTAAVLLIGLLMASTVLRAQDAGSVSGQTDNPGPTNLARSVSSEPQQNSGADPVSTQTRSSSSNDPKPAGAQDPAGGNDAAAASGSTLHGNFFSRLGQAYMQDWKGTAPSGPEPKYRGYPPPVTDPPFPFTVWPYGGSVTIGYPWTQSGPLMEAIWSGPGGEAWKKSGIQIYGWVNGGFNVSTSTNGHYANAPTSYDIVPNSIQPDQEVLYIERQPDTVQTDHFDWGFRVATLYGIDYRFTTAKGWFSHQLLHTNPNGTIGYQYGVDPVMVYLDLYFPHVAEGLNVRIGRYISLPDIEAQLAPNNYTYSHSLLYTFDCYTQTGVNATVKLSNHWLVQAGISPGCDIAPWVGGPEAKTTFNGCVGYTWRQGWDNIYGCDNSLNSGKYSYNNLQAFYLTWYHKFNSSWHMAWETWYQYERNTPNVNNPAAASLLILNANGAVCASVQQLTCFAPEWATVNYVEKEFSKKDYMTIRNEYFDDIRGQRTGFKTRYIEDEFAWGHWIGSTILFRPELRYEHAFDAPAYSTGTKKTQFTAAGDMIFFF